MKFKPNKIKIRIAHFFGFLKSEEHIDDVMMNLNVDKYTEDGLDAIVHDNKETVSIVEHDFKKQIQEQFKNNPKFEKRCRNVCQVWVTFYRTEELKDKNRCSIAKMLYYSKEGKLYYPYEKDNGLYKLEIESLTEK